MKWLFSDEDFNDFYKMELWGGDLAINLWENGIISPESAKMQFIYASTDNDMVDCPHCGNQDNKPYVCARGDWACKKCRGKFSITSKRYIDNTKTPLTHWWRFCYITAELGKFNSCYVSRDLGVTQKTAWWMIDTVKRAMKHNGITMTNATLPFKGDHEIRSLLMKIEKKPITNILMES